MLFINLIKLSKLNLLVILKQLWNLENLLKQMRLKLIN